MKKNFNISKVVNFLCTGPTFHMLSCNHFGKIIENQVFFMEKPQEKNRSV